MSWILVLLNSIPEYRFANLYSGVNKFKVILFCSLFSPEIFVNFYGINSKMFTKM
jgi:hypothetical protein